MLTAPIFVYGIETSFGNFRFSRFFLICLLLLAFKISTQKKFLITLSDLWIIHFWLLSILYIFIFPKELGNFIYLGGISECFIYYFVFRIFSYFVFSPVEISKLYIYSSFPSLFIALFQQYNLFFGNTEAPAIPFFEYSLPIYDRLSSGSIFGYSHGVGRLSGAMNDPNIFCIYGASIALLSFWASRLKKSNKMLLQANGVVWSAICFFTFSKSGYLSFICGAFLLFPFRNLVKKIALTAFSLYFIYPFIKEFFEVRFSLQNIDSGHWEYTKQYFGQINWLGHGVGSLSLGSTHRLALTLVLQFGILGILFYLFLCFLVFKNCFSKKCKNSYCLGVVSTLLCVFIGVNLYDCFLYYFFWFFLSLVPSLKHRAVNPSQAKAS